VILLDYLKRIEELIKKNNGTLLTSNLSKNNIPRTYLSIMIEQGKLERLDRGIYISPNSIEDEMYALQSKYKKIIYSHETALYLHGLSDRTPFQYSATVPSGYRVTDNLSSELKIYYVKKDLHNLGLITTKTSFGNEIFIYDIERTLCDIIRSRNKIDIQILNDALKKYVLLNSNNYNKLMNYAKKLRVKNIIKNYLEILI
jgi:predicted transcriptional regulator of viral defense system